MVNAIVAHERAMKIASTALLNLEFDDITMGLEPLPVKLRGLSHRELGDATGTLALLMETTNPAQGRLRGVTNEALITQGRDELYGWAQQLGRLFVPFDDKGWPLATRVARHVAGLQAIFAAYSSETPERALVLDAVPAYADLGRPGPWRLPQGAVSSMLCLGGGEPSPRGAPPGAARCEASCPPRAGGVHPPSLASLPLPE